MKKIWMMLLVFISAGVDAKIVPADGLWRTTDDPQIGSGLMFATEGEMTLVSVFTYDADGNNVWYVATGQVNDEGLFSADLLQTDQGEYLLNESPQSAEVIASESTINIQFNGSQMAALSIDESEPKIIRADHFGLTSVYKIPDLTGKWVLGDAVSGESYILDLNLIPPIIFGGVSLPYRDVTFSSSHVSTENWQLQCTIILGIELNNSQCDLVRGSELDDLKVNTFDIGNQRMTFYNEDAENSEKYQAFRLNKDRRLLPSDGHWRTYDDPAIGSGVVMRTQGDYTVVLLYSYDVDGKSKWQIASGFFDESGKLVAELNSTQGGTAINHPNPQTAMIGTERSVIEIQGTNLATLSIDDSPPKTLKSFVFGLELFETLHKTVHDEPFKFPDQQGAWVLVNEDHTDSRISLLQPFDLNWSQSPPDPRLYEARQYDDNGTDDDFNLTFFCTKILSSGGLVFDLKPYCYGRHFIRPDSGGLKMFYEDIGVNKFRYYFDGETNSNDVSAINRDSDVFYLFRLNSN